MVVSSSTSSDDHFQYQNLSFTHKLFDILSDERNREIVTWNRDGDNFEVLDPKALERDVLPRYFRHSRFQSLVRQLNFYSFKKVGKERSSWIYYHEYFKRGQPELLISLKRKTNLGGMVHRSNPIRTTANPPAWKASSARVRQDAASATRPHRDSFDSMDSKCLTQISDLSTLSERDDEDDDQNEEEENESIETIEQPKEPLVTPSPKINMTSIVPLLQLSTIGTWYPLCTLQKQEKKDSFGGKVPIFPRVGIDPFFFEGLHSKLGLLTTSLKSQTSSPKSSFSEDFHTDIEDMEEVQLSFTNKATLSLLIILEQRSLRIDQFNAIMSFLHHLYQLPSASCNTTYEIFHFLALYPELSYEIALYMQALNCSIDNLPFFKGKEQKTLSENICQKNSSNQSFIFGGDLTKSQVQEIISHFLRYTMNLLQDILGDLQKLTYGSESMNEFIACGSCSQFYSFQKELTQSFNYLSRQYDLITTL